MTTPYRVYIAAASAPSEIERVERWTAKLAEIGVEVVSTWPEQVKRVGAANPRYASHEQRREWARICVDQVAVANLLWLLCPPEGVTTRGAWFEFGAAEACGTDTIASGDTKQTIFTALADEECSNDEGAFAMVKAWAEAWDARQKWDADKTKRTKAVRK